MVVVTRITKQIQHGGFILSKLQQHRNPKKQTKIQAIMCGTPNSFELESLTCNLHLKSNLRNFQYYEFVMLEPFLGIVCFKPFPSLGTLVGTSCCDLHLQLFATTFTCHFLFFTQNPSTGTCMEPFVGTFSSFAGTLFGTEPFSGTFSFNLKNF